MKYVKDNRPKTELISEHDMTKKMLDFFRNPKKLIKEETRPDDTITPVAGDAIFNQELDNLSNTVDSSADITSFKIYPSDNNVIIEGTLQKREDVNSGINFKMELLAGEVKTTMSGLDLDDRIGEILKKLKGYYVDWSEKWYTQIKEYKNKQEF